MTPPRVLHALRTAEVGTREFLAAVAWLVKREQWDTVDGWLAFREAELAAGNTLSRYRPRRFVGWTGGVQPEEKAA